MRLLTDEQHAQIVEVLDTAFINDPLRDDGYFAEALATLTAAPSLEVVSFKLQDGRPIEAVTGLTLYAIKKETPCQ